jgi:hypothetical protein
MSFKGLLGNIFSSFHPHRSAITDVRVSSLLSSEDADKFLETLDEILTLKYRYALSSEDRMKALLDLERECAAKFEGGPYYVLLGAKAMLELEKEKFEVSKKVLPFKQSLPCAPDVTH